MGGREVIASGRERACCGEKESPCCYCEEARLLCDAARELSLRGSEKSHCCGETEESLMRIGKGGGRAIAAGWRESYLARR